MNWAAPDYAWLIPPLIAAAILLRRAAQRRRRNLIQLTGDSAIPPARAMPARQRLARLLPATAFLLIIAALCRPQWGQVTLQQQSKGLDILIALDVSRSMLADDLHPTRLAAAKDAVTGLLSQLQGDRIGLIAFAGSAFLVCPLTSDYSTFAAVLAETGPDTLPLGGTSLAGALSEARRAFGGKGEPGKFLIVISDGEDHGSAAAAVAAAAEDLRSVGVTVVSVAAGTLAGGLIPLPGGEFLKNRDGEIVNSRMRTEPLRAITSATGDHQIDLATEPQALGKLYVTDLAVREKQEIRGNRQQLAERFQLPLALALFLLLIEPFIDGRRKP